MHLPPGQAALKPDQREGYRAGTPPPELRRRYLRRCVIPCGGASGSGLVFQLIDHGTSVAELAHSP